ncbi:MAG TPA: hemerythrin domain-containing protein [Wenzhouxiangella sp.]|nr:hemerythrin domain-containing protein [Wenzhouxiangella sp.]
MLRSLFGRSSSRDAAEKKEYAPGTRISYDPKLIERFEGHHAALGKLLQGIVNSAERKNYSSIESQLKRFQSVLEQHVLEENVRLYVYLEKCLLKDEMNAQLSLDMKREMGEIGRKVAKLVRHYTEFGVDKDNVDKFLSDIKKMGGLLQERIDREENSLYTLYLPPSDYGS